jgi:hypothetical protein
MHLTLFRSLEYIASEQDLPVRLSRWADNFSRRAPLTYRSVVQRLYLSLAAMAVIAAAPAFAHHSFNAYDISKTETVSGAIKEFRWGAPHSSMVLIYVDKSGKQQTMSVISGSPLMFSKQGFAPRDFHRGDKVTVTYHPNTSGGSGGALATLTLPDGRTFKDNEAAAAGGPGAPALPAGPPVQ